MAVVKSPIEVAISEMIERGVKELLEKQKAYQAILDVQEKSLGDTSNFMAVSNKEEETVYMRNYHEESDSYRVVPPVNGGGTIPCAFIWSLPSLDSDLVICNVASFEKLGTTVNLKDKRGEVVATIYNAKRFWTNQMQLVPTPEKEK